jgi:hypothetical protein
LKREPRRTRLEIRHAGLCLGLEQLLAEGERCSSCVHLGFDLIDETSVVGDVAVALLESELAPRGEEGGEPEKGRHRLDEVFSRNAVRLRKHQ